MTTHLHPTSHQNTRLLYALALCDTLSYDEYITFLHSIASRGGDVNYPTDFSMTALHLAVENNNKEYVLALLASGADINAQNAVGNTALHLAVMKGNMAMVQFLLAQGANATIRNNYARYFMLKGIETSEIMPQTPYDLFLFLAQQNREFENTHSAMGEWLRGVTEMLSHLAA